MHSIYDARVMVAQRSLCQASRGEKGEIGSYVILPFEIVYHTVELS